MTRSAVLALSAGTALLAACGNGGTAKVDALETGFDRNALLAHLATNILLPIQAEVDAAAAAVPSAVTAFCTALDGGDAPTIATARTAADSAWRAAVEAWAHADALLVGPAAMDNKVLRDRIYAWPALAPCEIDRDVISHWNAPTSYDLSTKLGRQRSLTTIEFLLYQTGTAHHCALEPAGWAALAADLPRARCRLAATLAVDVAAAATELHTAWRPASEGGGDYASELARAGQGSSLENAHEAVNLVSSSFFFVDRTVKDMKLGEAAGIVVGNSCGAVNEPCEREVELRYADRASFAIRANLLALREGLTGTRTARGSLAATDGPGFEDFLVEVGHPALAASMTADIDGALAKANALPDSFLGALTTNYQSIVDTHAAVKLFTNDLKSQFLTVLALDIPDDVASDND